MAAAVTLGVRATCRTLEDDATGGAVGEDDAVAAAPDQLLLAAPVAALAHVARADWSVSPGGGGGRASLLSQWELQGPSNGRDALPRSVMAELQVDLYSLPARQDCSLVPRNSLLAPQDWSQLTMMAELQLLGAEIIAQACAREPQKSAGRGGRQRPVEQRSALRRVTAVSMREWQRSWSDAASMPGNAAGEGQGARHVLRLSDAPRPVALFEPLAEEAPESENEDEHSDLEVQEAGYGRFGNAAERTDNKHGTGQDGSLGWLGAPISLQDPALGAGPEALELRSLHDEILEKVRSLFQRLLNDCSTAATLPCSTAACACAC